MERMVKSTDYDYLSFKKIIDELCKKYNVLQRFSIGKSCADREIIALKINDACEYVLFAAAFHGSEHITSNVLLYFIEEFAYTYINDGSLAGIKLKKALGNRGIIFVPLVNPDGCEISVNGALGCCKYADEIFKLCGGDYTHWNANLRGVDINHNFSAGWHELHEREQEIGITGPAPTRFGGYIPESEPETAALTELCKEYNIHHAVALHSQGEVIYWNFDGYEPQISKQMAEIMAITSGYELDIPIKIATGGGFKDWFIKQFSKPAFTVEVGKGENPLPIADAIKIYGEIRDMLTVTSIM